MTTIIVLLCIVILLLAGIIAMMVTGWPGRERREIERAGNALRKEMAEHRSESIQLLHSIRIEVEDSVKEAIEREMANYGSRGRSRASKAKAAKEAKAAATAELTTTGTEEFDDPAPDSILAARQLPLFGVAPVPAISAEPAPKPSVAVSVPQAPRHDEIELVPETIFVGYIDDIPDVE